MPLAGDIGLAGLPLGIERVELLVKTLLGRLSGVDGAADLPDAFVGWLVPPRTCLTTPGHRGALTVFKPKNRRPFHRVPVIPRAMAERLL